MNGRCHNLQIAWFRLKEPLKGHLIFYLAYYVTTQILMAKMRVCMWYHNFYRLFN